MFAIYLREFRRLWRKGIAPIDRRAPRRRSALLLESLEARDLPAPLAWSAGVTLPSPASGLAAQAEGSNLLVLGGPSTNSYNLSVTDPSWLAKPTPTVQALDFARLSPGIGPLPGGYILVYGGMQNGFATSAVTQYDPNTQTVVDGVTNKTRSLRSMNAPRGLLAWAADISTDTSYAIGGVDNNGTPLASVEAYNPTTNTWAYVAPLPQTLYSASAISDGAGHIYTFGGVGADGTITSSVYRYTIATNSWDQVAPLQVGVRDSAAVLASNGTIYVMGGTRASGATATVESYNIAANAWTLETPLPQAESSEAAVNDSLGRIELIGGRDVAGNPTAGIEVSQELAQPDMAPTITSLPGRAVLVNTPYSYQVRSTGNPQPTYVLTAAPAGMTIDPGTGLISWLPGYAAESGPQNVTVVAGNAAGQVSQSFTITVSPQPPTGLTVTSFSTTGTSLSWNASPDPNIASYNIYIQHRTVYHSPRGSGGGVIISYVRVAGGITGTSVTIAGSGSFYITAVTKAGVESARFGPAAGSVPVLSPPNLYVATTVSGADISSLTLNVGQTGQINLIQEGANPAPTYALVSGPSGIVVDPATGHVTYTPSAADIGTQVVTFSASNIAGTSKFNFTFVVQALNPTVTVTSDEVTYDGMPHMVSAAALGIDGQTPVAGSLAVTYNGLAMPPTAAGTYTVTATFTSADPAYTSGVATGSLIIDQAAPTVSVTAGSFNFDGNPHAATATAVGVDGASPVVGSFLITYNGDPTPPTAPGLYAVTATFFGDDPNYVYSSVSQTVYLTISSPGTLGPTLFLTDGSAPYDGTPHADSGTALAMDGVTPVAGDFLITYNGSTTPPTQAGSYTVVAAFISSDSTYVDAVYYSTLTISAVAPNLAFDQTSFTYDGTSHAVTASATGIDFVTPVAGAFTVTYNGSPTPPTAAGTYDVVAAFQSDDPDYLSASMAATLTIAPATPSVFNAGPWKFTYDGTPKSLTGGAVGIDGVTPVNGTFTFAYFNEYGSNTQLFGPPLPGAPTDAGTYTFIESFTSLDPNYADGTYNSLFNGYLTIAAAPATVTVSGGPFTYNGSQQQPVVTAVGIDGVTPLAGTVTITYNNSNRLPSSAGTYAIAINFTPSDPNYVSAALTDTLVINKATPSFSRLSSPTITVGAATVTLSGRLNAGSVAPGGDDVAITLNGVTMPATVSGGGSFSASFNVQGLAAGTYPITYAYLGDGTRFNAASAAPATGTLTIQAPPTILANPVSQTVASGTTATFTASASGWPAPTVQWQVSTDGGNTYANIAGAISATLTLSNTAKSQSGYHYRAVFKSILGTTDTTDAILTVV